MADTPLSQTSDLVSLINSTRGQIGHLREEAGKLKEMLDDIFQNDPTYQTHDAAVKEASKIRSGTRKQILKMPQAADLTNRIQSLRSQIKERGGELSDYLQDYSRSTGANSFETEDGQVLQIIYTAKLAKIGQ
jgi:hypothetical protein